MTQEYKYFEDKELIDRVQTRDPVAIEKFRGFLFEDFQDYQDLKDKFDAVLENEEHGLVIWALAIKLWGEKVKRDVEKKEIELFGRKLTLED